ncbi:PPR: pentatricopeptide repeat domain containing protein [Nitzschia inconspicua]|uniref:PPR: pentatricopeptide repeat domain containing protein n=1 Tax=Nitzschia inconspicua TaxID=303405 RepID=A0A9K3PNJ2_9STRA|nr:PPR: pentatricopeptide repeat domain containing protein [Nitzschia inconspicua]
MLRLGIQGGASIATTRKLVAEMPRLFRSIPVSSMRHHGGATTVRNMKWSSSLGRNVSSESVMSLCTIHSNLLGERNSKKCSSDHTHFVFHQQRRRQQQMAVSASSSAEEPNNLAYLPLQSEKRMAVHFFWESLRLAADLTTPPLTRSFALRRRKRVQLFEEISNHRHRAQEQERKKIRALLHQKQPEQKDEDLESRVGATSVGTVAIDEDRAESQVGATPVGTLAIQTNNKKIPVHDELEFPEKELVSRLHQLIKRRQAMEALGLFEEIIRQDGDFVLSSKITSDLFFLLAKRHPVAAYRVLQYFHQHYHSENLVLMYKRLCLAIREMEYNKKNTGQNGTKDDVYKFISALLNDIEDMTVTEQQVLYPILIVSLTTQRRVFVGRFAHRAYDTMAERGLTMDIGWLAKLLSLTKYNRQDDLPYHDILSRLVQIGGTPHSTLVMPVIHNMFPYMDREKMNIALQALLKLETERKNHGPADHRDTFRIDVSTLEMISNSAATVGDANLILLVWELLDISDHDPTETIFENTILAFASQANGLHRAFVALESMKEYGLKPSRALIRSFSYIIRSEMSTIEEGLEILLQSREEGGVGNLLSLESLNVIMSGYAERGDPEQALEILRIMGENGIQPNEDSFSFAIEVLGKDIHRRGLEGDQSHVLRNLETADLILTRMERDNILPSSFVIRQYVELLCQVGEVDTATSVVEDCLSSDCEAELIVCNKSLYRVALANAEAGNCRKAKDLAGKMSEKVPVLGRKIQSKEQRHNHLLLVKQRMSKDSV